MNCQRAFEIDLEDLLVDPASPELREFEAHCEGCPDCAGELALQRGLLVRLKDSEPEKEHPSDALLLRFRRDPDALPDAERAGLRAHLRDCAPCEDAYRATLMLVPEPERSPLARLSAALREWLVPSALPAWAPTAIALLLVSGVFLTLDPLGLRYKDPGPLYRSIPSEFAMEVELAPERRTSLSLYGLADDDVVLLRLELPDALAGADVEARLSFEDGAEVHAGTAFWDAGDETGVLVLTAADFDRDTYVVDVASASGATTRYTLDVR
jgi:hypothetical protein